MLRFGLACAFLCAPAPAGAEGFLEQAARAAAELRESFASALRRPAGVPRRRAGEFTLRVLTYNVNGLPSEDEARHERYAKIGRILARLREEGRAPHIVALQEAFHPRTEELLAEAGYPFFRSGAPATSDSPLRSGLFILSEFPIEAAATVDFRRCLGWDCWANKGVLHARVRVPGLPRAVEVYGTHMNADDRNDADEAGKVRSEQASQMLSFMGYTRAPGAPALFAADFNFRPGRPEYALFAGVAGMRNAAERCAHSGACAGSASPEGIWRDSVDHHFYLPGSEPEMTLEPVRIEQTFSEPVDGQPLSDHLGLEVHYRISS